LKPEVDPGWKFWTMKRSSSNSSGGGSTISSNIPPVGGNNGSSSSSYQQQHHVGNNRSNNLKRMMVGSTHEEIQEESKLITDADEANELLESYYTKGFIRPSDMHVFKEEVSPQQWSRRIKTLERIGDKVPVYNVYPAYATFNRHAHHLRHLFQEYDTSSGGGGGDLSHKRTSLFTPKDKLYLTRLLLEEVFDFDVLKYHGIIEAIMPLHDSQCTFGDVDVDTLLHDWALPWYSSSSKRIGGPWLSHWTSSSDYAYDCPFYYWPWAQPFNDIRNYFGENIALYYAWIGNYSFSLLFPAFLGIVLEVVEILEVGSLQSRAAAADDDAVNVVNSSGMMIWYLIVYSLCISLWTLHFVRSWESEEKCCGVKWGNLKEATTHAEVPRSQFLGDGDFYEPWYAQAVCFTTTNGNGNGGDRGKRMSRVSFEIETYYPSFKRNLHVSY
jgi:hypothetical protein